MITVIEFLAFAIGAAGALIIVWGAVLSIVSIFSLEHAHLRGSNICPKRELVRHHFGSYILLGLEFLVAADVLRTIVQPTLNEMAVLGSLVAIRTVLSYFLNQDLAGHTCGQPEEQPAQGEEVV